MKRALILLLLTVLCMSVRSASAHVLITDETNTKGAILHVVPDDDPIAGQQATLYLDTQNQPGEVTLSARTADGESTDIAVKTEGTLVSANYTFPVQGVYELIFTVHADGKTYVFKQSQRVSRGATASAVDRRTHAWAEILLLASGVGFALLTITAFNRRHAIAKQSKR